MLRVAVLQTPGALVAKCVASRRRDAGGLPRDGSRRHCTTDSGLVLLVKCESSGVWLPGEIAAGLGQNTLDWGAFAALMRGAISRSAPRESEPQPGCGPVLAALCRDRRVRIP